MIESVPKAVWSIAWSERRGVTLLVIMISVLAAFLHPFVGIFPLAIYVGVLYSMADTRFLKEFASMHNFSYAKKADMSSVTGRLFKLGSSRSIYNVVSGTHKSYPIRFFRYNYSTGSGKERRTYSFTVCELSFAKTFFPHILLQSRSMGRYAIFDRFGDVKDEKIPLPKNFGNHFKLSATKGYGIEVFEIFTEEVLQFLADKAENFSIEFAENKIYIYDDKSIVTSNELTAMLEVVQKLLETVGPLLDRMHDDFSALHSYYNNEGK